MIDASFGGARIAQFASLVSYTNSAYGSNGSYNGAPADESHQSGIGYGIYASFLAQILMN